MFPKCTERENSINVKYATKCFPGKQDLSVMLESMKGPTFVAFATKPFMIKEV